MLPKEILKYARKFTAEEAARSIKEAVQRLLQPALSQPQLTPTRWVNMWEQAILQEQERQRRIQYSPYTTAGSTSWPTYTHITSTGAVTNSSFTI